MKRILRSGGSWLRLMKPKKGVLALPWGPPCQEGAPPGSVQGAWAAHLPWERG